MTNTPDETRWATMAKRPDGRYSIIDISSKENAQALADEMNTQHKTDNYYIEQYEEKKHAYSRHDR